MAKIYLFMFSWTVVSMLYVIFLIKKNGHTPPMVLTFQSPLQSLIKLPVSIFLKICWLIEDKYIEKGYYIKGQITDGQKFMVSLTATGLICNFMMLISFLVSKLFHFT